jgi:hypothetical protein
MLSLNKLLNPFHAIESNRLSPEEHVDLILKYGGGTREENIGEAKESIPRMRDLCIKLKINCLKPNYEQIKRVKEFVDSRARLLYGQY